MPTTLSPLRYPGGKTRLYDKVVAILHKKALQNMVYIEPFAGGSGLALKLLLHNDVSSIVINDIDPAIYMFWYCVLNETKALCDRLLECNVTIAERDRQIDVLRNPNGHTAIDIGFSTLFLNRTNISGILNAGPIGGREQTAKDKLGARFNKAALKDKITEIAAQKHRISLHNLDVIDFIDNVLPKYDSNRVFLNFDPPYVNKGRELYMNHFCLEDHKRLRDKVSQCSPHWIVTYDYCETILDLYASFQYERIQLNHSAGTMKKGEEVIIYSNSLRTHKDSRNVPAAILS